MSARSVLPDGVHLVQAPGALDYQAVSALLASVGMRARDPVAMARAVEASTSVVAAYRGDDLVGFGRLISDGVYYGTIWDVAVSRVVQGQGIGRAIVEALLATAREQRLYMLGLFTALHNRSFYQALGFTLLDDIHPMTAVYTPDRGPPTTDEP
jgi:GNAT superfamily N-acetyltransferase